MNLEQAFQNVWNRLYNPRSGCPDVELGHVLCSLADVLIESGYKVSENKAGNWAAAYLSIAGKTTLFTLCVEWSNSVPRYTDKVDENGYPVPRPYDDVYADEEAKSKEMREAVKRLVADGVLIESTNPENNCIPFIQVAG